METMRNRLVLSLTGIGLLLVGVAGGILISGRMNAQAAASQHYTVNAGSSQMSKYCATYEAALADALHLPPAQIEQANVTAMTQVLDQLQKDGQITRTEHDQLVPLLKQLGVSPCTHLDGKAIQSYLQGNALVMQQGLAAHAALTSAVAGALHLTPDALTTALGKGQTVPALARQQGVAISDVRAAYLKGAQSFLSEAVSSGLITQAQADSLNRMLASAVAKDSYPLVDSGMPGMTAP
jgi:hypothetical protein